MNRTTLAAFLVAAGGTVAGGFALLSSTLAPSGQFLVECAPDDGDCVLAADPAPDQCAVLLEGGGDRPGEVSGLDGPGAQAARDLYAMMEAGTISGFRTLVVDGGACRVAIALSRAQATEWHEVLVGSVENPTLTDPLATLTPANPTGLPVQWGGGSGPQDRTEAWDLAAK